MIAPNRIVFAFLAIVSIAMLMMSLSDAGAEAYYVSNDGSNGNSGLDSTHEFLTIAYAKTQISIGDTLYFMNGLYAEANASGLGDNDYDGQYTTLNITTDSTAYLPAPGCDSVVITGYGDTGYDASHIPYNNAVVIASSANDILVRGITVKYSKRGIRVQPSAHDITITNCVICSTGWTSGTRNGVTLTGSNNNAGIIVFRGDNPTRNVTVDSCEIFHNWEHPTSTGVNGCGIDLYHVVNFTITHNNIYDQPSPSNGGIYMKNGNYPSLVGGVDSCNVSYNTIYDCFIGINVCHAVRDNDIHHNKIFGCSYGIPNHGPLPVGMYCGFNRIYNNTIYQSSATDYSSLGIIISPNEGVIESVSFWNNIVVNTSANVYPYGFESGDASYSVKISDYNLFYNTNNSDVVRYEGLTYTLAEFQASTVYDDHSISLNPQFLSTNPASSDFLRLDTANSPVAALSGGRGGGAYEPYMGAIDPDIVLHETTFTISGTVTLDGSGLSGVSILGVTTNGSGVYTATRDSAWSGTATPTLSGYTFSPSSRSYSGLSSNQSSQNYTATAVVPQAATIRMKVRWH